MNESIESIVTEMRERADAMQTHGTTHGVRLAVLEFARRIEAAWKRERAKVEADALTVGGIVEAALHKPVSNAAAMRRLLIKCARWILTHDIYGHMSKELLAECKKVLGDDGNFLMPKGATE